MRRTASATIQSSSPVTKRRGGSGAVRAAESSGAISAKGSGRVTRPSYKGTCEKILLEKE
jgi:hypothetical protein